MNNKDLIGNTRTNNYNDTTHFYAFQDVLPSKHNSRKFSLGSSIKCVHKERRGFGQMQTPAEG